LGNFNILTRENFRGGKRRRKFGWWKLYNPLTGRVIAHPNLLRIEGIVPIEFQDNAGSFPIELGHS
jgi:hypothetical protein